MIKLGKEVKDVVTGFKGIVISRLQYLTGCDQYGIVPPSIEGKEISNTEYIDENRLKVIGKGIKCKTDKIVGGF